MAFTFYRQPNIARNSKSIFNYIYTRKVTFVTILFIEMFISLLKDKIENIVEQIKIKLYGKI